MAKLTRTAIVCASEEEFLTLTQFRQSVGVSEFVHVTTLVELESIDGLTNAIYLSSGTSLEDFGAIKAEVSARNVSQKWQ